MRKPQVWRWAFSILLTLSSTFVVLWGLVTWSPDAMALWSWHNTLFGPMIISLSLALGCIFASSNADRRKRVRRFTAISGVVCLIIGGTLFYSTVIIGSLELMALGFVMELCAGVLFFDAVGFLLIDKLPARLQGLLGSRKVQ